MTWNEALEIIRREAIEELGESAQDLGIVWGTQYPGVGQDFTVTFRNENGEKKTYQFHASTNEIIS